MRDDSLGPRVGDRVLFDDKAHSVTSAGFIVYVGVFKPRTEGGNPARWAMRQALALKWRGVERLPKKRILFDPHSDPKCKYAVIMSYSKGIPKWSWLKRPLFHRIPITDIREVLDHAATERIHGIDKRRREEERRRKRRKAKAAEAYRPEDEAF